ncbi:MAG: hypothetical protein K0R76_1159 [Alphaproteobacteria bacterium]|jgi:rhodanese-related sulfurtransferase|nr:hypothetical protein [Alphaproteobacteria bacterium]
MDEGFAMTMKTIKAEDLYRRIKLGHTVVLLDVRSQSEYDEGHIAGAKLYPLESFRATDIISHVCAPYPMPPTIYITCAFGSEAGKACQLLADAGYEYIMKLEGGMYAWITAGLPLKKEKDNPPVLESLPIHQQMQIAVGSVVAIGALLGTFVNTGFLAFPLLAGAGLMYEGFCGTDYLKETFLKLSRDK